MEIKEKLKKIRKKRDRLIFHISYQIFGLIVVVVLSKTSLEPPSYFLIFTSLFLTLFSLVYFGGYLLERIAIQHNYKRSLFWLLGKFLSVIINLSLTFTYCYMLMYYRYPDSMENSAVLGTGFFEEFLTFFHFSLGNFLGMDSQILVTGVAFKIIQIIQTLIAFCLLIFLFSNYNDIKEGYSRYYKDDE